MLFGKKRGSAAWGRTPSRQLEAPTTTQVARTADEALSTLEPEEENVVSAQDDISQIAGDPIQQLFSTLGKLHRHLNKMQHSPANEGWCDDCMSELMTGLEISIACEWTPVKDALIDAARVLHSYEKSGKAAMCVPFLQDSYELLSLMVGDLIVDKVREGVKQKWREHYMRAVEELEGHGVTLVEDEEREVMVDRDLTPTIPASAPASSTSPPELEEEPEPADVTMDTEPSQEPEETPGRHESDTPEIISQKLAAELDDLDFDLPALSSDFSVEDEPGKVPDEDGAIPFPATSAKEDTFFDDIPESDTLKQPDDALDLEHILLNDDATYEKDVAPAEDQSISGNDISVAFDSMEWSHTQSEQDLKPAALSKKEPDDGFILPSVPEEVSGEATTIKTTWEITSLEETTPPATEDDLPIEEATSPEIAQPEEHVADTTAVAEEQEASEPESVLPEETSAELGLPEEPPREEENSPSALLQRVQQSILDGNTRNTKSLALELAVAMARLEYEQSRQELAVAEQQLLENGKRIEKGEEKVAEKERELLHSEELLAARDSERNACRERISHIDEELTAMSSELADIDAQIAALQERRREQLNRIENKQGEHEEAIDAESRTQTELESLIQETESIRGQLNEARTEVRNQYADRRATEIDIVRAQEVMESRRLSLAAIERTLHPEGGAPPKKEESDSLL